MKIQEDKNAKNTIFPLVACIHMLPASHYIRLARSGFFFLINTRFLQKSVEIPTRMPSRLPWSIRLLSV